MRKSAPYGTILNLIIIARYISEVVIQRRLSYDMSDKKHIKWFYALQIYTKSLYFQNQRKAILTVYLSPSIIPQSLQHVFRKRCTNYVIYLYRLFYLSYKLPKSLYKVLAKIQHVFHKTSAMVLAMLPSNLTTLPTILFFWCI